MFEQVDTTELQNEKELEKTSINTIGCTVTSFDYRSFFSSSSELLLHCNLKRGELRTG